VSADALSAARAQGAGLLGADPAGLAAAVVLLAVERQSPIQAAALDALAVGLANQLGEVGDRLVVIDLGGGSRYVARSGAGAHEPGPAACGPGELGWVMSHNRAIVLRGTRESGSIEGKVCGNALPIVGAAAPVPAAGGEAIGTLAVYGPPGMQVDAAELLALRRIAGLAGLLVAAANGSADQGRWTVQTLEAERARLAADIHDGIAQRLVSLTFHLDAASRAIDSDPAFAVEQVAKAQELAQLAAAETRAAIGGLRPPVLDDLGLPLALLGLARTAGAIAVDTARVRCQHRMPDAVQTAFYRIAQEALQNVVRHAGATQAVLTFECSVRDVRLTLSDDGVGWEPGSAGAPGQGVGLAAMRQRAVSVGAAFAVRSRRGAGTTVEVVLTPGHPADDGLRRGDDQPGMPSR